MDSKFLFVGLIMITVIVLIGINFVLFNGSEVSFNNNIVTAVILPALGYKNRSQRTFETKESISYEIIDRKPQSQSLGIHRRLQRRRENETKALISKKLKTMGLSSVDDHEFKSIYIIDPVFPNTELAPTKAPGKRKTKIVSCVFCYQYFRKKTTMYSYNRDFKNCPYRECIFDAQGRMQWKADMMISMIKPKRLRPLPPRPEGQIWVHACWEPYCRELTRGRYGKWGTAFNYTMGHSTGDDFFSAYNHLGWRSKEEVLPLDFYVQFAKRKSKTAVWWVSHCNARSQRDQYVMEMKKYIDIDIYGNCGSLKCNGGRCIEMLNDTYKFYLAFENAFCEDYVTEKLFKNFQSRTLIIPVVRGAFEYEEYLPPNTVIDSKNFKSAKNLALYLKDLGNDVTRYAELLRQKDHLVTLDRQADWCDVCEMLHTGIIPKRDFILQSRSSTPRSKRLCWSREDIFQ